MSKKIVWLVVSCLMVLSLVMASCGPAAEEEAEVEIEEGEVTIEGEEEKEKEAVAEKEEVVSPDTPRYGGTFNLALTGDVSSFDFFTTFFAPGNTVAVTNDALIEGDWTKGPAGGYGTNDTDWGRGIDLRTLKAGILAESWTLSADFEKGEANLVYNIRPGVHFALNPASEASRLVGGREMTADDVVYTLRLLTQDKRCYVYSASPELRVAEIDKTGPWEVTVKVPAQSLMTAFQRLNYWSRVIPPEVIDRYGNMSDWRDSVGTGAFMLTDYVVGSVALLERNSNYWMKNPVGPGAGDQLPYADRVRYLIIPDSSTRQAALRTGKVDQMLNVSLDDAAVLRRITPQLIEKEETIIGGGAIFLRVDQPPTNDVRVRRALIMATDLETIRQGLYGGQGEIHTFPWPAVKGYEAAYLALDDPRMPESVRELYTYNPEKAKQLLAEAGYPAGFKVEAIMTSGEVDYYSILEDMWSKVGVELEFMILESGAKMSTMARGIHPPLASFGVSMVHMYHYMPHLTGKIGVSNPGMINDPVVNEAIARIKQISVTDEQAALSVWGDELMPYVLGQAFAIPRVVGPTYKFWWPWLKNYSGEEWLGGDLMHQASWYRFIWIDEELKKSMGY